MLITVAVLAIVAGGLLALPGVLLLAAFAFRRSGAAGAASEALSVIPAGRAVRAAGAALGAGNGQ